MSHPTEIDPHDSPNADNEEHQAEVEPLLQSTERTNTDDGNQAVPSHMNGLQIKTLSNYEKRKDKLVGEEMFFEKRADEILYNFSQNVMMLSTVFMTAGGALFAVGRSTFYLGFVCALLMAICFCVGVVGALLLALERYQWVKKGVASLQARYDYFYSQAENFLSDVVRSQSEGSGHGVGSHLQPLEEGSTSHSSSPSTTGSRHVPFAAERERMPVAFRVTALRERTRINSFLGHYQKVIYFTLVLALVQGCVFSLIAYIVFQVVIIPFAFPGSSPLGSSA